MGPQVKEQGIGNGPCIRRERQHAGSTNNVCVALDFIHIVGASVRVSVIFCVAHVQRIKRHSVCHTQKIGTLTLHFSLNSFYFRLAIKYLLIIGQSVKRRKKSVQGTVSRPILGSISLCLLLIDPRM